MASIILVSGEFNISMLRSFERSMKTIPSSEKTVIIPINSTGGNLGIFNKMSVLMKGIYDRGHSIIGQAVKVESAAMKLYLNCDEREVIPSSSGRIHLPVPNQEILPHEYTETRNKAITFIKRRTGLSAKKIIELDGEMLGCTEMIRYGIAHRKVPNFLLEIAG